MISVAFSSDPCPSMYALCTMSLAVKISDRSFALSATIRAHVDGCAACLADGSLVSFRYTPEGFLPVRTPVDSFNFSVGKSDIEWTVEHLGLRVELTLQVRQRQVVMQAKLGDNNHQVDVLEHRGTGHVGGPQPLRPQLLEMVEDPNPLDIKHPFEHCSLTGYENLHACQARAVLAG